MLTTLTNISRVALAEGSLPYVLCNQALSRQVLDSPPQVKVLGQRSDQFAQLSCQRLGIRYQHLVGLVNLLGALFILIILGLAPPRNPALFNLES